jgi:hypothetical protein
MRKLQSFSWRYLVLIVAAVVLTAAVAACGSSSGGSSSEGASTEATASVKEGVEGSAHEQLESEEEELEEESSESEVEHIMRIQIYGKFGGTKNEFDLVEGGTCKIVKINTTPAEIKADGQAILDHEGTASVQTAPAKGGATMKRCRAAIESAIG